MAQFPAILASVRGPIHLALASTSLLVISSAAIQAQALAPSTLHFTGSEPETKYEPVQVIKEPAQVNAKKPAKVITKETVPVITKKPAQVIAKDSARTFGAEPVRPMDQQSTSAPTRPTFHFSFKTPAGKKESAPVITQYYPKRIVYPLAKVD